jgi:hypothetical protein
MVRRRSRALHHRLDRRLGLDTLSFDTFGWPLISDDGECRAWLGESTTVRVILSECFHGHAPRHESLDIDAIRRECEAWVPEGTEPGTVSKVRVIEVGVDTNLPIVRTVVRLPLTEGDDAKLSFVGSLRVLLADCAWFVQVQARDEGVPVTMDGKAINTTGIREAFAFDRAMAEQGHQSFEEIEATFDPYDRRWDDVVPSHPLSVVRGRLDRLQASLLCGPEFYQQDRFSG